MKYCLKGLLGNKQRQTFFKILDVLALLCQDSITADNLPFLDMEVNLVLALIERDFPISVQVNFSMLIIYFRGKIKYKLCIMHNYPCTPRNVTGDIIIINL